MVEVGIWIKAEKAVADGIQAIHAGLDDSADGARIDHRRGGVHSVVDA